jgi:hypothetical protein
VGRAPEQVDEFLEEWVEPALQLYRDDLDRRDPGAPRLSTPNRTRPMTLRPTRTAYQS